MKHKQERRCSLSDLQKLLADQRDSIRSLAEQARDESNPQLVHKLEAEFKRIQKDFDKTSSEVERLKIPFDKRLLLSFSKKKTRGVRLILNLGTIFLSYSLIARTEIHTFKFLNSFW